MGKKGLRLCPLQGEACVYLAELAFLDSSSRERKHAYVAQGLRVRPHDGSVLFAAGREAKLAGKVDQALDLWRRSFGTRILGQRPLAANCAREAVAQTPSDFRRHKVLGTTLLRKGQYDEAVRELKWCRRRQPDDNSRSRIKREDTTLR